MNSRKIVQLFISTLFIGGIAAIFVGFANKWSQYAPLFTDLQLVEILATAFWFLGVGFIFSVISQMGFFAYLTIHRFGLGIFRSVSLWNAVQIILIAVALFDLVYLRYTAFATEGESLTPYIMIAVILLVFSLVAAYFKMKQTNKSAFVPAVFFLVVVTIIQWFPALRANDPDWLLLMFIPLFVCNVWQLLRLGQLTEQTVSKNNKGK